MTTQTQPTANNALIILLAGGVILALSFGVRSIFGGIVEPVSNELFEGKVQIFSLSIAIQNLIWGLAQPAFGIIADKYGDRKALWLGLLCYLLGMGITVIGTTPMAQHLGAGFLVGMGISGTAFGVVLAVIGRTAPVEKRTYYLGIASAMGSAGQVFFPLLFGWLSSWLDWRTTVIIITIAIVPMAFCIPLMRSVNPISAANRSSTDSIENNDQTLSIAQTIKQAFGHSSYTLLTIGFFVCGFHLAFITAHLPNYVQHFCVSPASPSELRTLGLQALALAGFANIFGTLAASWLGTRYPKPYILACIYGLRAVVILIFIAMPLTPTSVLIFALLMGGLWLSTVPLTSAMVLVMFGPKTMGTLYGFVFLSHQLGSFTGVWLGGYLFDQYTSYDQMWHISIVLAVLSAIIHLSVKEKAAPNPQLASA